MKVIDCEQGTRQWLEARSGIPTASEFKKILTPTGKPSTQADGYLHGLLAERMMGHPRLQAVSERMERGSQLESEAAEFYRFQRECDIARVGFVTNDAGTIGASPDRLVGDEGLLEIKVPAEHTHVSYLLAGAGASVDGEYKVQVMGQLWVTERKWADVLSYHPDMPPALFRVQRDEKFIEKLAEAVTEFSARLEGLAEMASRAGWIKAKPVEEKPHVKYGEFINDDDLAWALGRSVEEAAKGA